jgi:hypothetical protein
MAVFYFGRHRGQDLATVPSSYLQWALATVKLSGSMRTAVAAELQRRGVHAPAPPPPAPPPACRACRTADYTCHWREDSLGRRFIRARCARCRRQLPGGALPLVEPFLGMADATASGTPVLDALTRLEDLGIDLASDGRRVWFADDDYRRVPPDLDALVRQVNHSLARMLGPTRGADRVSNK